MSGACSNCGNDLSTIDFIQIESDGKSYVINVRLIVFSRYSVFKWLQVISWIAIGSVWMAIAHSRSSLSTNPTSSLDSSFHPPAHTFFLFPYRLDLNQCKSDILHRPFSFLCFFFFNLKCATYGFYTSTSAEYDVYLIRDANTQITKSSSLSRKRQYFPASFFRFFSQFFFLLYSLCCSYFCAFVSSMCIYMFLIFCSGCTLCSFYIIIFSLFLLLLFPFFFYFISFLFLLSLKRRKKKHKTNFTFLKITSKWKLFFHHMNLELWEREQKNTNEESIWSLQRKCRKTLSKTKYIKEMENFVTWV